LAATRYEYGNDQPRFRTCIPKIVQKKDAAMRQLIAMDQSTDVPILAQKDAPVFRGLGQQSSISWVQCPLGGIDHIVTRLTECPDRRSDDVCVSQDAHLFGRDDKTFFSRKLAQSRGIQEASIDVVRLENGIGLKHRLPICPLGQHGKHHPGRHAPATDDRFPAHLSRLGPDARKEISSIHQTTISHRVA
jgi:hypothetical protein